MPKETIVVGAEVSQLPNRVRRDELSVQFYETGPGEFKVVDKLDFGWSRPESK